MKKLLPLATFALVSLNAYSMDSLMGVVGSLRQSSVQIGCTSCIQSMVGTTGASASMNGSSANRSGEETDQGSRMETLMAANEQATQLCSANIRDENDAMLDEALGIVRAEFPTRTDQELACAILRINTGSDASVTTPTVEAAAEETVAAAETGAEAAPAQGE